jgi:predicted  nucleic acid-binding Zn-ribbon protein
MIEGHGPPHPPTIEPVTQEVSDIANNISKEIAKQTDLRVAAVLEDGGKDEWIAWFQGEVEHWKQRAEELEIELECMRNAFPEHDNDISPKIRGIY